MADFNEIIQRVSIRDVLHNAGLRPERNRIACPIHGGTNPTSFSYSDAAFICHSCGAKGGLLVLTEYLHRCSKQEALKRLYDLAGLPFDTRRLANNAPQRSLIPRKRVQLILSLSETASRLDWLKLLQDGMETALRMIRRNIKEGKLPLQVFYAKEQQYLFELEQLDTAIISMNYEVNRLKRGISNDKYSTTRN